MPGHLLAQHHDRPGARGQEAEQHDAHDEAA
jgi:hypothetical protein